jgi:ribosomal protein S18 acetylase RimI-like enzyme
VPDPIAEQDQLRAIVRGRAFPLNPRRGYGLLDAGGTYDVRPIRIAGPADADDIGRLLHAFNTEFDEPTPSAADLAQRVRLLFESGETVVVLAGSGPDGLALLRFRYSIWSPGLECYLAELYVVPDQRGRGLGRALMEAGIDVARQRGADRIDLGTSEDDTVARRLYGRFGFTNHEGGAGGPVMYVYERDL